MLDEKIQKMGDKMITWRELMSQEEKLDYFKQTMTYVQEARDLGKVIFPPQEDVFNAFSFTALSDVKVVILGQDPYHGVSQAHGLCFSVLPGIKPPPSLKNMYKELAQDIEGFSIPTHGYLKSWTIQGVLLLNTVLTVVQGKAHSHAHLGWETFTDKMISAINQHCDGVVFLLWGAHARKKAQAIDREKHRVLEAPHPSPLSAHRGFLGCGHFSQTNKLLKEMGKQPIDWQPVLD